MKLKELIAIADKGYGDGTVMEAHEAQEIKGDDERQKALLNVGDTLAVFVAIELAETFDADSDDAAQLACAGDAITRAIEDLENVAVAIGAAQRSAEHGVRD